MGFGENIVFLRKMHRQMSQEELAEQMGVSRQTVSKWELNACYPEMNKVIELCRFFSCSMEELVQKDLNICDDAFTNIRVEEVPAFRYLSYAVVSPEPEDDAQVHTRAWAQTLEIAEPAFIGWDFPYVSQEQINVWHMHGYASALILPEGESAERLPQAKVHTQAEQNYVAITIREPFRAPFRLIPDAYQTLLRHIRVNRLSEREPDNVIPCFEKIYERDGVMFMDVFIAITCA